MTSRTSENVTTLNPAPSDDLGVEQHLLPQQLADRWHSSVGHLANQRSAGTGPSFLRLGTKILYRLEDVRAYEAAALVAGVAG